MNFENCFFISPQPEIQIWWNFWCRNYMKLSFKFKFICSVAVIFWRLKNMDTSGKKIALVLGHYFLFKTSKYPNEAPRRPETCIFWAAALEGLMNYDSTGQFFQFSPVHLSVCLPLPKPITRPPWLYIWHIRPQIWPIRPQIRPVRPENGPLRPPIRPCSPKIRPSRPQIRLLTPINASDPKSSPLGPRIRPYRPYGPHIRLSRPVIRSFTLNQAFQTLFQASQIHNQAFSDPKSGLSNPKSGL